MAMPKIKALLVDDEPHVRLTMKGLLSKTGIEVIGEAMDGEEAVALYRSLRPDLMLLDIVMPFKTGEEVLREVMAEFPRARIIMLSSVAEAQSVSECLMFGAIGYIRKDSDIEEIRQAIDEAWACAESEVNDAQKTQI